MLAYLCACLRPLCHYCSQERCGKAGIQPDDLIVAVDGQPITSMDGLYREVATRPVDSVMQVSIIRGETDAFNVAVKLKLR